MKYLAEYRDPILAKSLIEELHRTTTKPWNIMEICGGQTHSLLKNGIIEAIPSFIHMIHGPGCPVCVTPMAMIDRAIEIAHINSTILCSYGDMLRVPGSKTTLLESKAMGADIRMVYSPLDAVKIAEDNPNKQVIFFAVGFETTTPANALSVLQAHLQKIKNFSLLTSQVMVPPAMEALLADDECRIDAFLAAGHVCTIMGLSAYAPLSKKYDIPIVVTGFEPIDLLQGILMVVRQLENGIAKVENQYSRIAFEAGNQFAQNAIDEVFDIVDREWRGIGIIPKSGYALKKAYQSYNADLKFENAVTIAKEPVDCIAGQILKGINKPNQCQFFRKKCTPEHPIGAPMVSSEGACAAYYHYHETTES